MLPIHCIRCHRPYYSAAAPRPGVRCPICRGRLEVDTDPPEQSELTRLPIAHRPPLPQAEPGSYAAHDLTYSSLVAFVNEDPRRGLSPERDVGLQWRGEGDRTYRAAWVRDTGELYLVQTGPTARGGGHVELLGAAPDERRLADGLADWSLHCGEPHSVDWLRTRARARLDRPVMPIGAALDARRVARRLSSASQGRHSPLRGPTPSIG